MARVRSDAAVTSTLVVSDARLRPWLVAVLCLFPALTTPVLPLVDFYAHALRYDILANVGRDPALAENYRTAWKLLPNLGLDLIGTALFRILPALVAAQILALVIIAAPFAGTLVLARSLQGRISPLSVALAGILAQNFVLGWGFANFLLGLGLALAGLGLWISNQNAPRRQLLIAMPIGIAIFLTHGFVFAIWGLLLFLIEMAEGGSHRRPDLLHLARRAARLLLIAVVPACLFLVSDLSQGTGRVTDAFVNLAAHLREGSLAERLLDEVWFRADAALRVAETTWPVVDRLFGALLWGLLAFGLATGRLVLDRRLRFAVPVLVLLVVVTPPNLFGVGHLSERLPLCLLAVLAAGLSGKARDRRGQRVSRALIALLPLHLLMVTLGWARDRESYVQFLDVAETLPPGGLGAAAFAEGAQTRDTQRSCKPLSFLLGLSRGMAVPTFANPTQQPLAIIGPLAEASAAYDEREALTPGLAGTAQVEALLLSGFKTVVLCQGAVSEITPVPGATAVAAGPGWTLYRALRI
ncbi:hypothetical protein [Defluviimonas sp. SAOS-178_SWC]|uniref:hypothetical protein n=1 Tax=Defluviimonas sp. SAOS-178_SWC TaxID=3121287 RepID=UPI0032217E88